jgi:hypothetical protein
MPDSRGERVKLDALAVMARIRSRSTRNVQEFQRWVKSKLAVILQGGTTINLSRKCMVHRRRGLINRISIMIKLLKHQPKPHSILSKNMPALNKHRLRPQLDSQYVRFA